MTTQTAEDLADLIDLCWTDYTIQAKASTMLRQQAAEIASLHRGIDDAPKRIAQPEQSEPVAWIEHHKAGDNLNWEQHAVSDTPLYTQPKAPEPLTDDEIWKIHDECIPPTEGYVSPIQFARAVLAAQRRK